MGGREKRRGRGVGRETAGRGEAGGLQVVESCQNGSSSCNAPNSCRNRRPRCPSAATALHLFVFVAPHPPPPTHTHPHPHSHQLTQRRQRSQCGPTDRACCTQGESYVRQWRRAARAPLPLPQPSVCHSAFSHGQATSACLHLLPTSTSCPPPTRHTSQRLRQHLHSWQTPSGLCCARVPAGQHLHVPSLGSGAHLSSGSSMLVSRKCPRWFTP